jgi:hypothetical protein
LEGSGFGEAGLGARAGGCEGVGGDVNGGAVGNVVGGADGGLNDLRPRGRLEGLGFGEAGLGIKRLWSVFFLLSFHTAHFPDFLRVSLLWSVHEVLVVAPVLRRENH